jgi:hypothetical protein
MGLMFELRASGLQSRPIEPYLQSIYSGYFVDAGAGGVSVTICLGWPQIMILPILVSQVTTTSTHLPFYLWHVTILHSWSEEYIFAYSDQNSFFGGREWPWSLKSVLHTYQAETLTTWATSSELLLKIFDENLYGEFLKIMNNFSLNVASPINILWFFLLDI